MKSIIDNLEKFGKMPLYTMLVFVVLAALYIVYDTNKTNQTLLGNHLDHSAKAIEKLSVSVEKNTDVLRSLETAIIRMR